MGNIQGLIGRLKNEVGYIEKASNSNLDSKTGNKGLNNYTKYARDINNLGLMGCQAQPWCATFQFWIEVQEFGLDTALAHFNMSKSTYVGYNVFSTKAKFPAGKRSKTPKLGCLVVFTHSHIGRVIAISGNTITTIEGNTSAQSYDRNGGMVGQKTYNINDSKIDCFLIIDYDSGKTEPTTGGDSHTVKKGDTLSKIAKSWSLSAADIASYNGISNPNLINIGQVIKKPSKQQGTASAGDKVTVDGQWGQATTKKAQSVFGTGIDGIISNQLSAYRRICPGIFSAEWSNVKKGGSSLVRAMQSWLGITQDGYIGSEFIKAFQRKMGTPADGVLSNPSACIKEFQRWLNKQ